MVKKIKSNNSTEEIRHFGVLLEGMDNKWDLVAEQYGDIKKTLDSHTKTLASHTEMIAQIIIDLAINKENVEFIKNSLKKKIDVEEFSALEKRVILLERKLSVR
jgi:GTPase involved in cell partitioning and DNA repair